MRRERVLLSVALLAFAAAGPAALAASTPKWQGKAPQLEDIFGSRLDRLAPACPSSHARAILAVASNENVALFNMFIRSWRTHSPRTHMVLFTHHPGLAAVNDPPYINVVLFNYTAGFGGDGTSNVFRVFVLFHFLEFCAQRGMIPAAVMLSDSRDSVATSNIWDHAQVQHALANRRVIAPLEGAPGSKGEPGDAFIRGSASDVWVRDCFSGVNPPEVVEAVLAGPISCSGTVLGPGAAMLEYTRAVVNTYLNNVTEACWTMGGSDQGVHNYIISYLDRKLHALPFRFVTPSNGHGPIYTFGLAQHGVRVSRFGVVTVHRHDWIHFPAYVHQIDRNPPMYEQLKQLYNVADKALETKW